MVQSSVINFLVGVFQIERHWLILLCMHDLHVRETQVRCDSFG